MQHPWAVAGCMKIPAIDHNRSCARFFLFFIIKKPACGVVFLDYVSNFALRFNPQFGRTSTLCFVASVFSLHEQRTGWSSRLGTERRWRAGGLFTIITRSGWRQVTDSRLGQRGGRLAISNTLYLESGYIIQVQQRTVEGGTSAGILNL